MGKNKIAAAAFDYKLVTDDQRGKLICLAAEAKKQKEVHVTSVLEMGRILTDAQTVLANFGNGTFCHWASAEIGIPKSTIYNYISAFEHFGSLSNVGQIELTAMYTLTKNEDAKNAAIKLSKKGVEITGKVARELIAKAEENGNRNGKTGAATTEETAEEPDPPAGDEYPEPEPMEHWEEMAAIHLDALGHLTQISKLLNSMAEEPHFSHVITRAKGTIKELRAAIYQHTPTGKTANGDIRTRIEERK